VVPMVAVCLPHMHTAAQPLVEEVGGGVGLLGVSHLFPDSTGDRLLLAGWFAQANGEPVSPGILEWTGAAFGQFGCGIVWDCVQTINAMGLSNPSRTIAIWNGDLYLGGDFFFTRNGVTYNRIMRWDGEEWQPVGGGMSSAVKSLKVIDGELIAAGWFTYADTVLCNGLARWDGERWHKVVDVPPFYIGDGPNMVQDVEKFQGQWYLGGNLPLGRDLVRYTGQQWEIVGGGFTSAFSSVSRLKVYNGQLFVAGTFANCPPLGNGLDPGNGIVAWDGNNWDVLGGGTCGSANGSVWDMTWMRDTLYACGNFNMAGGVQGGKLAKWDGQQWCMLVPQGYFGTANLIALAVHHDSLFIGGGFQQAGGAVVRSFGKWVGGNTTFACGALTSVEERQAMDRVPLILHPNPADDLLHITSSLPGYHRGVVLVLDATGRLVMNEAHVAGHPLSARALAPGAYTVVLHSDQLQQTQQGRFIRP
jgi:hypothetical protein